MPVMSEGIMSGVNWMRRNDRLEDPRDGADQQRLGQARHADQQDVAAGEQPGQQLLDHALLADDDLADLVAEASIGVGERGDLFGVIAGWCGFGMGMRCHSGTCRGR